MSLQRSTVTDEPIPQLVAAAIAGFVENNRLRRPPLAQEIIPAITMVGPRPIFYKVPVTQALVSAIITAQYPAQPTIVQRLVPPVPDEEAYIIYGMNSLVDRRIVFQCLEAMRGLLVSCSKFLGSLTNSSLFAFSSTPRKCRFLVSYTISFELQL